MSRETPQTDAAEYDNFNGVKVTPYVDADFARRLESQRNAAVEALRDCYDELKHLMEGEACDHSVGICWCSTIRALDNAAVILAAPHNEKL